MNYEEIRTIFELGSLALTIPLVFLCSMVVYECYPLLIGCIKSYKDDKKICWIIAGIFFGFGGNLIDNIYWAIPWTSNFLDLNCTADLVKFGVIPNVFFRQFLTSLAAYCHIRAFIAPEHFRDAKWLNVIMFSTLAFGTIYVGSLYYLKNYLQ